MKLPKILCVLALLLMAFSQANADATRAEASPLLEPGLIQLGSPFTVDIYYDNT